jgi:hypothetical protein
MFHNSEILTKIKFVRQLLLVDTEETLAYCLLVIGLHTTWSRVLLEKLIITLLLKKFCLLQEPKVHYRVNKSPSVIITLNHMNAVDTLEFYFIKIRFIIIIPLAPASSVLFLPSGLQIKVLYEFPNFLMRVT